MRTGAKHDGDIVQTFTWNGPFLTLELAFQERRVTGYNLGGSNKLEIPHVNTTIYGLPSYGYFVPHAWNNVVDNIRMSEKLATFKRNIIDYIY